MTKGIPQTAPERRHRSTPLPSTVSALLSSTVAAGLTTAAVVGGGVAIAAEPPVWPDGGEPAEERVSDLPEVAAEPELRGLPTLEVEPALPELPEVPTDPDVPDREVSLNGPDDRGVSDDVHGAVTGEEHLRPGDEGFRARGRRERR